VDENKPEMIFQDRTLAPDAAGTAAKTRGGSMSDAQQDMSGFAALGESLAQQSQEQPPQQQSEQRLTVQQPPAPNGWQSLPPGGSVQDWLSANRAIVAAGKATLPQKQEWLARAANPDAPYSKPVDGENAAYVDASGMPQFTQLPQISQDAAAEFAQRAVNAGIPQVDAAELGRFVFDAKLPPQSARVIGDRAAHIINENGGTLVLDDVQQKECYEFACNQVGGPEKFAELNSKARSYLDSVDPKLGKWVDEKLTGTALMFDVRVLGQLAMLHDMTRKA
jgi:hypothetical protein